MKRTFQCFLLTLLLSACNNELPVQKDMVFHVNRQLLSEEACINSSALFGIYPPRNWFPAADSSQLWKQLQASSKQEIIGLFKPDSVNCLMLVMAFPDADSLLFREMISNPSAYYNADSIWASVQSGAFQYNGFSIQQIILQKDELSVFKLFFSDNQGVTELNLMLPKTVDQDIMKVVESTIGSVFHINH
ncbi:MAG: hypothetical protein KGZ82_02705 [Bacteroidales bacterium]|nr:hypothetical protein [Bacteroidales bacterium]